MPEQAAPAARAAARRPSARRRRVFIDGEAGTTGLRLRARLAARGDIELLRPAERNRKDPRARARLADQADLVVLCLPDAAAREAMAEMTNPEVRIIDASSAHRVAAGWTYGFPEMTVGQAEAIAGARRVTNPGCFPTGAIALLRPLREAGLLDAQTPVSVNAVSGYSGGGRALIEEMEAPSAAPGPHHFLYALGLEHKHLPEMQTYSLLAHRPLFAPSVGRFRQGMLVCVPLNLWALPGQPRAEALHAALQAHYRGQRFVEVAGSTRPEPGARLDPEALNGTNRMRLHVFAAPGGEEALLVAQLDNLGKGASGAAVQCLNLMLGAPPAESLGD